jgi:hypothetical protein
MSEDPREFLRASRRRRASLAVEFWQLLRENKKWWLTPIVVLMLLLGLLSLFAGSAVAPFIYTLF